VRCRIISQFRLYLYHERYISDLENRLTELTKRLENVRTLLTIVSAYQQLAYQLRAHEDGDANDPSVASHIPSVDSLIDTTSSKPLNTDDLELQAFAKKMVNHLPPHLQHRFFGKGSTLAFIHTALEHKKELAGERAEAEPDVHIQRPQYWNLQPVSFAQLKLSASVILPRVWLEKNCQITA
jgi:hypothetical protein